MSVFPPPWPPQTTSDLALYALAVSILSLLISTIAVLINAVTFWLAERRRSERIAIHADFGYRIELERDRYLYPAVVKHNNLRTGERCCRLEIAYHGRHSLEMGTVYFEFERAALQRVDPPPGDRTLFDGQTRYVLLAERMFSFSNITGFVVETKSHGNQIKHVHHWHRIELSVFYRWPWLTHLYNWARLPFIRDPELRAAITAHAPKAPPKPPADPGAPEPDSVDEPEETPEE